MSSPRSAPEFHATLVRNDARQVGPIQLPIKAPEKFLEEFNRCYASIRLRIEADEIRRDEGTGQLTDEN